MSEYPACKVCHAEWAIIPAIADWDVETAYLRHKADCEYARNILSTYDSNNLREVNMSIEIFSSPNIDFKSLGATSVFTPTSDFVITGVTFRGVDVTGTVNGATVSIGNNSPDFNNFVVALPSSVAATDRYQFFSLGGTVVNLIKASDTVEVRVIVVDSSATTNTQAVDILGYYV